MVSQCPTHTVDHAPSRRPVVLLIEDDPGDVLMITEALEDLSAPPELYVAGDGQDGLDFLRREGSYGEAPRPDLILLDLNMPRVDGREALVRMKADERLRAIPVVVFTTSDAEADVLASYHGHAGAYVTKPLDLDQLEQAVHQIGSFYTSIATLLPTEVHRR